MEELYEAVLFETKKSKKRSGFVHNGKIKSYTRTIKEYYKENGIKDEISDDPQCIKNIFVYTTKEEAEEKLNNFIKAGVDNYLSLQTDEEKLVTKYVQCLIKKKALKGPALIDCDGEFVACLDKNGDLIPLDAKVLKIYDYFEMLYYYSLSNSNELE